MCFVCLGHERCHLVAKAQRLAEGLRHRGHQQRLEGFTGPASPWSSYLRLMRPCSPFPPASSPWHSRDPLETYATPRLGNTPGRSSWPRPHRSSFSRMHFGREGLNGPLLSTSSPRALRHGRLDIFCNAERSTSPLADFTLNPSPQPGCLESLFQDLLAVFESSRHLPPIVSAWGGLKREVLWFLIGEKA